ncbi:helix-turn-helix domain-containing protein [Candidatus Thiothrix anitrata]|jgi:predicted transcriptional regulator|nr:helix-turn-helix transcriptional regulator [Candidatus Thiothrix anitrata]
MGALTENSVQVIHDAGGNPAFAVIPYSTYLELTYQHRADETIPHDVLSRTIKEDMTPIRAWREHLQLTQAEIAERLGISQSAYAQQETAERPRKATREKIAKVFGIAPALLDF